MKQESRQQENEKESIEQNKENDYQLKICPTELYGDKLIKILEEEFETKKKKKD